MQSNFQIVIGNNVSEAIPLSTIHGHQPNVYSTGENSSIVMYNGAGTHKNASQAKPNNSMVLDKNHLLSQGNGVFFDSKAFEKMSNLHQINSQTGMPDAISNNLTTLNMMNPHSFDQNVLSTVTTHQHLYEEEKQRNTLPQNQNTISH